MRRLITTLCFAAAVAPCPAQTAPQPVPLASPTTSKVQKPTLHDKALQNLSTARNGLTCAGGVGDKLMQALQSQGVDVQVRAGERSWTRVEYQNNGTKVVPVIVLSDSIGNVSPRFVSLLLSEKAGQIFLADMPDSAEKDYMLLSMMSRSWMELGGDRRSLPDFDGRKDPAMSARITTWMENNMDGYVSEHKTRPNLAGLKKATEKERDATNCYAEWGPLNNQVIRIQNYQAQAAQFSKDETQWFMNHQGTVP